MSNKYDDRLVKKGVTNLFYFSCELNTGLVWKLKCWIQRVATASTCHQGLKKS